MLAKFWIVGDTVMDYHGLSETLTSVRLVQGGLVYGKVAISVGP